MTTNCRECPVREKTLFKNVPKKKLDVVQGYRSRQLLVPARSIVFNEDELHDHVYTLFSGWGILYKTVSNNNKRQILRFILPGMSHSASVITESIFCVFSRDVLKEMLKKDAALAIRLVDMEARDMSLCQNHLMSAGRKTARDSADTGRYW